MSSFRLQGTKKGSKCLSIPVVLDEATKYWMTAAGMPSPYDLDCTSLSNVQFLNYFRRCEVMIIFIIIIVSSCCQKVARKKKKKRISEAVWFQ
jgi:hypothetical protein